MFCYFCYFGGLIPVCKWPSLHRDQLRMKGFFCCCKQGTFSSLERGCLPSLGLSWANCINTRLCASRRQTKDGVQRTLQVNFLSFFSSWNVAFNYNDQALSRIPGMHIPKHPTSYDQLRITLSRGLDC